MIRYESIGQLLNDYQILYSYSQVQMSELLNVDERTFRRWKKNENIITDGNIKDIAEKTGISFEVLFRLNHDYPTLYDMETNRYTQCFFNKEYVNKKIIQNELFNSNEEGKIIKIRNKKNINHIFRFNFPKTHYDINKAKYLIEYTSEILPELNLIINDPIGFYSGHVICFPLSLNTFEKMLTKSIKEFEITKDLLLVPPWKEPLCLHFFSFYATCSTYVYCLIKRLIYYLHLNYPKNIDPETILSKYSISKDGIELCKKLDFEVQYHDHEDTMLKVKRKINYFNFFEH
jgi:hypothetical protein